MGNFLDGDGLAKLRRLEQLRETAAVQASDPAVAQRAAAYHEQYPWMAPDAKWSLAKAGISPISETARAAALAAAHMEVNQGFAFAAPGSPVTRPAGPVDVTAVARSLDQIRQQQPQTEDPAQFAAPPKITGKAVVESLAGPDAWNALQPDEQARLNGLSFVQGHNPYANDNSTYEVKGDVSDPYVADLLQRVLPSNSVRLWGPWKVHEKDVNGNPMSTVGLGQKDLGGPPQITFTGKVHQDDPNAFGAIGASGLQAAGVGEVLTPLLRTGFAAMAAPLQELQGQIRNVHQALNGENPDWTESQSDLGIAAGDLLAGRKVDLGSGVFVDPTSHSVQERQRRELERGTIGGQAITLGRLAAGIVSEPGSQPYRLLSGLVDARLAMKLDPTAFALKEAGAVREANKLFSEPGSIQQGIRAFRATGHWSDALNTFQDAGGISSMTRGIVTPRAANAWVDSPEQLPLWQRFADQTDTYTIDKALGGGHPELAWQLAHNADTPEQVVATIRDHLGLTIRTKPTLAGLSDKFERSRISPLFGRETDQATYRASVPSKWVAMMPGSEVAADDVAANVRELERAASLTKMPDADFRALYDRMAGATSNHERLAVWETAMHDTFTRILNPKLTAHVDELRAAVKAAPDNAQLADDLLAASKKLLAQKEKASRLTQLWREQETVDKIYSQDKVGKGLGMFDNQATVDGKLQVMDSRPHLLAQHLNGTIPLPDWRAVRTALSPLAPVMENPFISGAEHLAEFTQNHIWKPLQVATVKTMFKILGDEQAMLAARGLDGVFNHPLSALSIILATPLAELSDEGGRIAHMFAAGKYGIVKGARKVAGAIPGVDASGRLRVTVTGHDFEDIQRLQSIASHGLDATIPDPLGVVHAENWQTLTRTADNVEEFAKAWGRDLGQYAASPESRGFARFGTLQEAQDAFWDGALAKHRISLSTASREGHPELLTRAGSDHYVDLTMQQIAAKTNGNPDLVEAIATGRLKGTPIWATAADGTPKVTSKFAAKLENYIDDAPTVTRQQKAVYVKGSAKAEMLNKIVHRSLQMTLGTPSAIVSKIPMTRQVYWRDIIEKAPFMTADAQAEAVRIATNEANIGPSLLADLKKAISIGNRTRTPFSGTISLEQADIMAQGRALDLVEKMTDEAANRSQFMDVLRILSPFGEVWRKTFLRWGSNIAQNPAIIRRAQQGWEAAHGKDLGALMGAPADQGFFHTDSYGQEVFSIPGAEFATAAATGHPIPLAGSVQGLSLGAEFIPPLGPVGSLPVAMLLREVNAGPDVEKVIFPFGAPKDLKDVVTSMPNWFQRMFGANRATSPDSIRTFANSVKDVLRAGMTSGEYDMHTPEGISAAVEDATKKAHNLNFVRGAAQFFIPGAPAPQPIVYDQGGRALDAAALIAEYHNLSDPTKLDANGVPGDPNTAGERFLAKYGPDIFGAVTAKSYSYIYGLPTSTGSAEWVDAHRDVKRDLPNIYGYFAPPSDPNNFDYGVYVDQLNPGQGRAQLSPEQWARVQNARVAAIQYGIQRDKVIAANGGKEPDKGQRAWLASVKQKLIDYYPGYADALYGGGGLPDRADPKLLVMEAKKALDNPTVKATDAGKGLELYWRQRKAVDDQWVAAGYVSGSWASSTNAWALQLRDYLRGVGAKITSVHAQFGPLMESVFEREMRDDTNPADLTGGT